MKTTNETTNRLFRFCRDLIRPTIDDGAKLKLGVTVRNRKTVRKGATVGMGAVVVSNVDAGTIVIGNPAKRMI